MQISSANKYKAMAYVTVPASENWRWIGTDDENGVVSAVDTRYVTHINFAFASIKPYQFDPENYGRPLTVDDIALKEAYKDPSDGKYHYKVTLDSWIEEMSAVVSGGKYLKALVDLKKQKPELKVLLSIGGWNSDGFCYMARTPEGRAEFIESCIDVINEYGIDGIDLDWEFPTNGGWGALAHCEHCVDDAKTLLIEMRKAFDSHFGDWEKIISVASGAFQSWVDADAFKAIDYINIMCYDFDVYNSGKCAQAALKDLKPSVDEQLEFVVDSPENRRKINYGIPFFNGGGPYLVPSHKKFDGIIDANAELTEERAQWVKEYGLGGIFYWAYSMDTFEQDVEDPNDPSVKILQKTVYNTLNS